MAALAQEAELCKGGISGRIEDAAFVLWDAFSSLTSQLAPGDAPLIGMVRCADLSLCDGRKPILPMDATAAVSAAVEPRRRRRPNTLISKTQRGHGPPGAP